MLVLPALAKRPKETPPPTPPAPAPPTAPVVPRLDGPLFPRLFPFDPGPLAPGLANASADACAACHPTAHDGWSASAHAGPPPAALLDAAVGLPACLGCHLPLVRQHEVLYGYDQGQLDHPIPQPNPGFDAAAWLEGVGCAACHLRDGAVVAAAEGSGPAPHPLVVASDLGGSEGCAACHQLTWPGAAEPLYDTYGEWQRSAFGQAGVGCGACHLLSAAEPSRADHGMTAGRAVSVLLDLPSLTVERGAEPVAAAVVLQNTGAGHAWPTGSPFRGVQVEVRLEGPPDKKGLPTLAGPAVVQQLVRRVADEAPFATTEDARLPAGGTRRIEVPVAIPADAPTGAWTLVVALSRTVRGVPVDRPFLERRWPLRVQ